MLVKLKILKEDYISREKNSIQSVENEINILRLLKHQGIIGMLECGD